MQGLKEKTFVSDNVIPLGVGDEKRKRVQSEIDNDDMDYFVEALLLFVLVSSFFITMTFGLWILQMVVSVIFS